MKIALISPPFIAVPPKKYGGTELFIAELAKGLKEKGIKVVLYANGASTVPVETRWIFESEEWPLAGEVEATLKGLMHSAWAVKDASGEADVIHLNSAHGLTFSHFVSAPFVYTVHHPLDNTFAKFYKSLPDINYVTISDFQRQQLSPQRLRTIHHGIDLSSITVQAKNRSHLAFLGRIAPSKGTHLAIEIAKESGIPLKIAGEIQPVYEKYWEEKVKPHVDGKFIEYIGDVGGGDKQDLLGNAKALLFPIQWDEPFGLVQIEAMAYGTPVLAMPGGSVAEIVKEGVSGHIRGRVQELAELAKNLNLDPRQVRAYAEENFSTERMVKDYIQLYSEIISENSSKAEPERVVA
ncbi:MAG TPA: glycosyltransferase family 4 protein [Candidatus Angelobacter sp.]|nr:glycosyltransferase family 4 protein [Candidatus Angelobacter sp.]